MSLHVSKEIKKENISSQDLKPDGVYVFNTTMRSLGSVTVIIPCSIDLLSGSLSTAGENNIEHHL